MKRKSQISGAKICRYSTINHAISQATFKIKTNGDVYGQKQKKLGSGLEFPLSKLANC